MDGKIRHLTTRTAWIASSLLAMTGCNKIEKAAGEEEPALETTDVAAGVTRIAAARPPTWPRRAPAVQLGPRPFYLVDDMDDGPLKSELLKCSDGPFRKSDFSIGHRGSGLQFPEHTKESYEAAARMGAGIIECDVTFTKDRQLVCRHSQCDLHTTTNILAIPALAAKCTQPFQPADPVAGTAASANCCTSDITLAEFKTLCGKMDGANPSATTVAGYMAGTPTFRTDLYATCGTVMSHQESIQLIGALGAKFTPELKAASVTMPYEGNYTQEMYAQQMVDEYKAARVPASQVFAQSFNLNDVLYLLKNEPRFGAHAVYLDDRVDATGGYDTAVAAMPEDHRAANVGPRLPRCEWQNRSLDVRRCRQEKRARSHHMDPRTLGAPGDGRRVLFSIGDVGHQQRRRHLRHTRRARPAGQSARNFLGLARYRDVLREL
jgi:glycerophosphoryl diester phosphodiesterase